MVNSNLKKMDIPQSEKNALIAAETAFHAEGNEAYLFDYLGLVKKPQKAILATHMYDFQKEPDNVVIVGMGVDYGVVDNAAYVMYGFEKIINKTKEGETIDIDLEKGGAVFEHELSGFRNQDIKEQDMRIVQFATTILNEVNALIVENVMENRQWYYENPFIIAGGPKDNTLLIEIDRLLRNDIRFKGLANYVELIPNKGMYSDFNIHQR